MSKIRTKKIVFSYDKYVNSTIMVTHFIEILLVLEFQLTKFIIGLFLIRPILDPKFPLMKLRREKRLNRGCLG